jgi:hypothetical protein
MARRSKLDRRTAEELLDNDVHPDDAFPGLASLAAVLTAAATHPGPVTPDAAFMASLAAAVQNNPVAVPVPLRRKPVLARIVTAKAATVAAVMIFGAAGAAAATDNLPDGAQHGVATAASHIGINLPDSANDHARAATEKHTSGGDAGQPAGDDNNGGDHAGKPTDNHGADVSGVAHETEPGADHGATVCATASDGKCTEHRGSGDDHTSTTVGDNENENENEHTTTTTGVNTSPDEGHHGGGNSGPGNSNNSGQGGGHSGRD